MGREIDDVHLSPAAGLGAGERFVLQRLNESPMNLALLLAFHG
jgi:hypothetical protein